MIRTWLRSGAFAAAVVVAVVVPQTAYAGVALADGYVYVTNAVSQAYTFNTVSKYWSIVGLATAADYDITLRNSTNTIVASSTYGTGVTDWIAINSNDLPLDTYTATVTKYSGTGAYFLEQRQGHTTTALPVPDNDGVTGPSDPDLAFASVNSQDVLSVSDIYLTAGQKFWVDGGETTNGTFFLLESNPADPSTFIRTRYQASTIAGTSFAEGCTLFTANYSGWHGLVEVYDGLPHLTNPVSGIASALDAFDPSRPNTCPQRNFPAPTPAGP
jgi:hypothetical protein